MGALVFIRLTILYIKTIEGKEMERKFGEQYLNYKKSVSMFILFAIGVILFRRSMRS